MHVACRAGTRRKIRFDYSRQTFWHCRLELIGEASGDSDGLMPAAVVRHGYPPAKRQKVIDLHKQTGLFPAKFGCGDWVWCHYDEQEGRWQVLSPYEDLWRFKLLSSLSRCGSASAQLVLYQGASGAQSL